MRNKEEDVKKNTPRSQKPRVLSKPRSMERGAKFKHFGAEFSHLPVEEAPDFLNGTN